MKAIQSVTSASGSYVHRLRHVHACMRVRARVRYNNFYYRYKRIN